MSTGAVIAMFYALREAEEARRKEEDLYRAATEAQKQRRAVVVYATVDGAAINAVISP